MRLRVGVTLEAHLNIISSLAELPERPSLHRVLTECSRMSRRSLPSLSCRSLTGQLLKHDILPKPPTYPSQMTVISDETVRVYHYSRSATKGPPHARISLQPVFLTTTTIIPLQTAPGSPTSGVGHDRGPCKGRRHEAARTACARPRAGVRAVLLERMRLPRHHQTRHRTRTCRVGYVGAGARSRRAALPPSELGAAEENGQF